MTICAGLAVPRVATAQDEPGFRDAPDLYLFAGGGLGTPVAAGGGVGFEPWNWLGVEAGGGVAWDGPQAFAAVGLNLPVDERETLGIASGLSMGRYTAWDHATWDRVVWSNTSARLRIAFRKGFVLRLEAGVAVAIEHSRPHELGALRPRIDEVPFVGGALEYHLF